MLLVVLLAALPQEGGAAGDGVPGRAEVQVRVRDVHPERFWQLLEPAPQPLMTGWGAGLDRLVASHMQVSSMGWRAGR